MENQTNRILLTLDSDVTCEFKNINIPIGSNMILHNHDGYELFLMVDGDADFYMEGSAKKILPGDLFLIQPYAFHHVHLLSRARYDRIVINIKIPVMEAYSSKETDLSAVFLKNPGSNVNVIHLNNTELDDYIRMSSALQTALKKELPGDDILSEALLKQLLIKINRHSMPDTFPEFKGPMPELIAKIFSYVEEHLTDETLSVQSLADFLHHNSVYISRSFKKVTGTSLQQYIIAKKIVLAQQYLREDYNPCDVCYLVGFHNYSNFSRTFSKQTGLSPKQYQQKNKV